MDLLRIFHTQRDKVRSYLCIIVDDVFATERERQRDRETERQKAREKERERKSEREKESET
jgi:hypothetical protein